VVNEGGADGEEDGKHLSFGNKNSVTSASGVKTKEVKQAAAGNMELHENLFAPLAMSKMLNGVLPCATERTRSRSVH
jgi:hypothetical protein